MNTVKVYQAQKENDRDFCLELDFKRGADLVKVVEENMDRYTLVATIHTGAVKLSDILERGYSRTNSYELPWYKDTRNCPTEQAAKGCRSTSVGDILEYSGVKYVVDGYGFKCLEDH
jgi:hypothetical protein